MSEKTTTSGAEPQKLAELLEVAVNAASPASARADGGERAEADLLRVWLAGGPPAGPAAHGGEITEMLDKLRADPSPTGRRSLGEVLLADQTPLAVLETIKAHGRDSAARSPDAPDHDVAITVYFAAIAAALVFHHEKITSYSCADLVDSFGILTEKGWMAPELSRLFTRAREYCRRKTG